MSYYEEDTPDVSENERERAHEEEIIGIPGQPDWPSGANYAEVPTELGGGFLRDPDVVALEKKFEATLEQTDPGEMFHQIEDQHKELMEMLGAMFVQLSRIYDVLMMQLPANDRLAIDGIHAEGGLAASPPVLREDAWSEDNSASKD